MDSSSQPKENSLQTLRRITLQWLITTLAIFAAMYLVPGITFDGPGWQLGIIAMIFSLINQLLKPILTLLTCPMIILTLGLFTVVINAVLLLITAYFADFLGINFAIDTFTTALFGALVVSFTSLLLNLLSGEGNVRVHVNRG
ncbi:MAG: phage holin family protein [Chloroflexota bacterium]